MSRYEKRQNILKIIMAPVIYYVITIMVSIVYSLMCTVVISRNEINDNAEVTRKVNEMLNGQSMLLTLIGAAVTIPIVYFRLFDRDGEYIKKSVSYIFVILFGFGSCISLNILISALNLAAYSKSYQEVASQIYSGSLLLEVVSAGIVIPVVEELIFRGVIFKRINAMIKTIPAVLLSAVIFGAVHGNLVQFVYATCLGVALSYVYIRCKSILAPIALHMSANISSVLITDFKPVSQAMRNQNISAIIIIMAFVFAVTMPALINKYTGNINEASEE